MTTFHNAGLLQAHTSVDTQDNGNGRYWVITVRDEKDNAVSLFMNWSALVEMQSKLNVAVLSHLGDRF